MSQVCHRAAEGVVIFMCPGCKGGHGVWTDTPNPTTGARWGWNGSLDKPTFTPSVLIKKRAGFAGHDCHSWVTDGVIHFLGDCSHELAGKSVTLEPF